MSLGKPTNLTELRRQYIDDLVQSSRITTVEQIRDYLTTRHIHVSATTIVKDLKRLEIGKDFASGEGVYAHRIGDPDLMDGTIPLFRELETT